MTFKFIEARMPLTMLKLAALRLKAVYHCNATPTLLHQSTAVGRFAPAIKSDCPCNQQHTVTNMTIKSAVVVFGALACVQHIPSDALSCPGFPRANTGPFVLALCSHGG